MAAGYDFAIFGAGPLAALLSGLLAHDHARQVIRIAAPVSPQRLPRAIHLALPFATRPASWRMLRDAARETAAVLDSIEGTETLVSADVKVVADTPATATALAHMSNVAAGYGFAVRSGLFRRVPHLSGEIDLGNSRVQTADPADVKLSFGRSGAEMSLAGETLTAGHIVIADDAALLELLPEADRPDRLVVEQMTATLTAPAKRLPAQVMRYPDRGVTLTQRPDMSVLALVSGERDVEARLASCLPGPFPLQRRATTHFRRITTSDGAPFIGRVKPSKLIVVAGLGDAAAFLAPPLARLLVGVPTDDEKPWFTAHNTSRPNRDAVADFVGSAL